MKTSMAICRRYSRFMLDALSKNPKIGSTTISQQFFSRLNRRYDEEEGWFHNPKGVRLSLVLLGVGAAIGICSGRSVMVPYTERKHFILFHEFLERLRAQQLLIKFEGEGEGEGEAVVPPLHPDNITARRIFEDIMDQAQRSRKERLFFRLKPWYCYFGYRPWNLFQLELETEELKCSEIIVLDSPALTATAIAKPTNGFFGKLYVTTGLFHHYRDHQPMIAAYIGRLVGHELTRHHEEMLSKFISTLSVIGTSVYLFSQSKFMPDRLMRRRFLPSFGFVAIVVPTVVLCLTKYRRKMIMEAEDVGMMLASSAGYTPRVDLRYSISGIQYGESKLLGFLNPIP